MNGKYLRILLFFITKKSNDLPRRGAFEHGGFVVGHKVTVHGEGVAIEVGADIDTDFIGSSRQCQVKGGRYGSAEDGEIHEEKQWIGVGNVMEVGHRCEFIKPGDIAIYPIPAENPVPFYKFGWVVVNENRILAIVNEKLTERKNNLNKN